jgi:DNA-directed RNA polymerase specialized sigma24 family protein
MPRKRVEMTDGENGRRVARRDLDRLSVESVEEARTQAVQDHAIRKGLADAAHRALAPRELSVFLLHGLAGLPYDATAEALAVSVPACRTAWASATKKLRRCYVEAT